MIAIEVKQDTRFGLINANFQETELSFFQITHTFTYEGVPSPNLCPEQKEGRRDFYISGHGKEAQDMPASSFFRFTHISFPVDIVFGAGTDVFAGNSSFHGVTAPESLHSTHEMKIISHVMKTKTSFLETSSHVMNSVTYVMKIITNVTASHFYPPSSYTKIITI